MLELLVFLFHFFDIILDYLRKYTWDKRLESVVKASVMMRGSNLYNKQPTVIHPQQYRTRFLLKMKSYFPPVPDHFSKFKVDFLEENSFFYPDNTIQISPEKLHTPFWFHEFLQNEYK